MMQDLVVHAVYIGYALAVLMGMGTILTWVERRGHYTNFQGVTSAFEPCFAPPQGALHAAEVFAALALREAVPA